MVAIRKRRQIEEMEARVRLLRGEAEDMAMIVGGKLREMAIIQSGIDAIRKDSATKPKTRSTEAAH